MASKPTPIDAAVIAKVRAVTDTYNAAQTFKDRMMIRRELRASKAEVYRTLHKLYPREVKKQWPA